MKKLLGILFVCLTLTTYSQEYDDLYYTVYDDTTVESTDTLVDESNTYVTNNYYTDYPSYTSRIRRFHSNLFYFSYWSFNNIFWSSYYYPHSDWYSWYGYNPYSYYYGYYGWNYNNWYSHHHHNHHWYNNHSYATNTYYGPHYKKSQVNKKIKTIKSVSKVKPKPVINKGVRTVNKPIKTSTTYTTRSQSHNSINKVSAYNGVNSRTYNKPTPKVNTHRPKVTTHQTYQRPTRSFTPRSNSFNRNRTTTPSPKTYNRSRPR